VPELVVGVTDDPRVPGVPAGPDVPVGFDVPDEADTVVVGAALEPPPELHAAPPSIIAAPITADDATNLIRLWR
jgi:hypothetical protein